MKRIGILGGTFDPVHLGHVHLALDARKEGHLDKVVLVPARQQPFKLDKKTASGKDRLTMIHKAVDGLEGLEVSTYEMDSEDISYTYLTLRAMRKKYGSGCRLYFITGTDSFLQIEKWKNPEELLTGYSYLIGTRPGYRQQELETFMDKIRIRYNTEIRNIRNDQFDISSTQVRRRIADGVSCSDLIPSEVERYIKANGLYKD